jgi:hypothetical protein
MDKMKEECRAHGKSDKYMQHFFGHPERFTWYIQE